MPVPLVSVIIPTFQRPRLLLGAVRSVLDQTLGDLECIVVVDGHEPDTTQAFDSVLDARLRLITLSPGVGSAGARNAGVGEARGRWIAFLDDDDQWLPQKLEIQLRTAKQTPGPYPIVSCRLIARSEEGDLVWPLRAPSTDEPMSHYLFCQSGLRGGEGLILPSTILTTKDLLVRVPFRTELPRHNDVDWLLRAAALEGVQVAFVAEPEPLVVWNIETNRARISNTFDWRYSVRWIRESRTLVTPRAYASFLLIWASATAARGRCWRAFWLLPWEALRRGKPAAIDLLAHGIIWLTPRSVRSRVSVLLSARTSKNAGLAWTPRIWKSEPVSE